MLTKKHGKHILALVGKEECITQKLNFLVKNFFNVEVMKIQIQTASEVKNSSRISTLAHETREKIVKIVSMLSVVAAIVIAVMLAGCQKEMKPDGLMKPKSDYEAMLKQEVNVLLSQKGLGEESFLMVHGLPSWENLQWVHIESKDMIVVPLLTNGENKKCILGVVTHESITAIITELSAVNSSENRIFSLNNKLLYDKTGVKISSSRLKNGNENGYQAYMDAQYLLWIGGSAQLIYNAAYGSGSGYNGNANAGTLSINASSSGNPSSTNISGHAWIGYTDNFGNYMTIGTWGNQQYAQYFVNLEIEKNMSGVSHSVPITYNQFQSLLNYNSQAGNTSWSNTYNCSGYAAGVWNAVTGQTISGWPYLTPSHIQSWINNQ